MTIQEKFARLGIDNAPGQEALQKSQVLELRGVTAFKHNICAV